MPCKESSGPSSRVKWDCHDQLHHTGWSLGRPIGTVITHDADGQSDIQIDKSVWSVWMVTLAVCVCDQSSRFCDWWFACFVDKKYRMAKRLIKNNLSTLGRFFRLLVWSNHFHGSMVQTCHYLLCDQISFGTNEQCHPSLLGIQNASFCLTSVIHLWRMQRCVRFWVGWLVGQSFGSLLVCF